MKALVTGAAGFVGANLVRALLAEGHEVIAAVRDSDEAPRLDELRDHIDIRSSGTGEWMRPAKPNWVFNLAAFGAYSWQTDHDAIVETNMTFTAFLLERTDHAEAFVQAGSSSEYGYKDHAPSEEEEAVPNSVYAASKLGATEMCQRAGRRLGRPTLTARLYSVYGPYEDPRRLIPTVIREGLGGRLPPFVDPEIARDFVHVDDVCEALILLAKQPAKDPGGIYNIASGVQTKIRDVARIARARFEIDEEPHWQSMPNRNWDTTLWIGDPSKIEREVGWKSGRSFEQGFEDTVGWYRQNQEWLALAT